MSPILRMVLLQTTHMSPAAGGLAVSIPTLAHGLNCIGQMEAHVVGPYDSNDRRAANAWGPRVHALEVFGPQAIQFTPSIHAALMRLAPDVVDVQGLWTYPAMASLWYARRTKRPYMITPRGMLDPWSLRNSAWKKRAAKLLFQNSHLRESHCLRATAEMEAEHFRNEGYTGPIAIVPNAIEIPKRANRQASSKRTLLFLSRIHPKKGIKYLLDAWRLVHSEFEDWQLVIAGIDEGGHERELQVYSKSLGLSNVSFPGEFHGEAKQQRYRDADIFVLPTHAENFGLVVAEALAQETPVITTTNAPWSGLVDRRCGWWIELNVQQLADTLRSAMSLRDAERDQMGRNGREWISRAFSVERMASDMCDLYHWLAGRATRPATVFE